MPIDLIREIKCRKYSKNKFCPRRKSVFEFATNLNLNYLLGVNFVNFKQKSGNSVHFSKKKAVVLHVYQKRF